MALADIVSRDFETDPAQRFLGSSHRHLMFDMCADRRVRPMSGLPKLIAEEFWPELADLDEQTLGTMISRSVVDRTFHALFAHRPGSSPDPELYARKLNVLDVPADEQIGICISVGSGYACADTRLLHAVKEFVRCNKTCVLYLVG